MDNRAFWNLAASAYDLLTAQEIWRDQCARLLDHAPALPTAPRVLDLGCGPGMSTFAIASRLGPGAEILGVDLSENMIARARAHQARRFGGLSNARFDVADASALPFGDGAFDLVTGHSFLYLVPDRARVLAEARRVLAPGGTLVFLEPSDHGTLAGAARAASLRALFDRPMSATRFATSMVTWRLASRVAGRMTPDLVSELFRGAGFSTVECHPTLGGLGLHCVGR